MFRNLFKDRRVVLFTACVLAWVTMVFGGTVAGATVTADMAETESSYPVVVVYDRMAPVKNFSHEELSKYVSEIAEEAPAEEYLTSSYDDDYVNANVDGAWIAGSDFAWMGVYWDSSGYSYTYYSENVLPGGGLSIPGRHVGDEGYVMDGNGNLCLASDDLPYGTVVSVPFGSGTGVVYDCGSGYGNLDVYVSW